MLFNSLSLRNTGAFLQQQNAFSAPEIEFMLRLSKTKKVLDILYAADV